MTDAEHRLGEKRDRVNEKRKENWIFGLWRQNGECWREVHWWSCYYRPARRRGSVQMLFFRLFIIVISRLRIGHRKKKCKRNSCFHFHFQSLSLDSAAVNGYPSAWHWRRPPKSWRRVIYEKWSLTWARDSSRWASLPVVWCEQFVQWRHLDEELKLETLTPPLQQEDNFLEQLTSLFPHHTQLN